VSESVTYEVPAIHCAHCAMSIREEVSAVEGVEEIAVDLDTRVVTVSGHDLDDPALRAAIADAGYEAA
jgi:copper chaperone